MEALPPRARAFLVLCELLMHLNVMDTNKPDSGVSKIDMEITWSYIITIVVINVFSFLASVPVQLFPQS